MHLSTNPVHGKRYQANTVIRIKPLDGFHQADIAFLYQVTQRQSVTGITFGHVHDETQMR